MAAIGVEDYLHRLRSSRIIFTADGKCLVRLRSIREALRSASRRRALGSISTSSSFSENDQGLLGQTSPFSFR